MVPKCEVRGEGLQNKEWMPRSWDEDFLKYDRNKPFRTPCLPVLKTESSILRGLVDNILPPILTPKPNLVYSMSRFAFTEEEQALNDLYPMFTTCHGAPTIPSWWSSIEIIHHIQAVLMICGTMQALPQLC